MELEKSFNTLYGDICKHIEDSRSFLAQTANKTLTLLYWKIGYRLNKDFLEDERAEYGKQIVSQLATQLQMQYGKRGFQERNIRRMMRKALFLITNENLNKIILRSGY